MILVFSAAVKGVAEQPAWVFRIKDAHQLGGPVQCGQMLQDGQGQWRYHPPPLVLGREAFTIQAFVAGPDGSLYLAYGARILRRRNDRDGSWSWVTGPAAGSVEATAAAAPSPAVDLDGPVALAVDSRGRVYLLDRTQRSIRTFHPDAKDPEEATLEWAGPDFQPRE